MYCGHVLLTNMKWNVSVDHSKLIDTISLSYVSTLLYGNANIFTGKQICLTVLYLSKGGEQSHLIQIFNFEKKFSENKNLKFLYKIYYLNKTFKDISVSATNISWESRVSLLVTI